MFEFAFGIAVGLLGVIAGIHFHFSGKIEEKEKEAESEYAKEVAKICKEGFRSILKRCEEAPTSPTSLDEILDSMEKFWVETKYSSESF
jgi:NAD(P)H-nitrite reductase large subunit